MIEPAHPGLPQFPYLLRCETAKRAVQPETGFLTKQPECCKHLFKLGIVQSFPARHHAEALHPIGFAFPCLGQNLLGLHKGIALYAGLVMGGLGAETAILGTKVTFSVYEGTKVRLGGTIFSGDLMSCRQQGIKGFNFLERTQTKSFVLDYGPTRKDSRLELLNEGFHLRRQ